MLGNSILCYMKELIHARAPYENYTVAGQSEGATDNGENALANMPSVIVEVGFHTNPSDAAALQDPVFRTAAMKGVEKGYRLYVEGEPCRPLKINAIPAAAGLHGTTVPVYVNFDGYPEYPLDVEIQVVSCAPGWTCAAGTVTWPEEVPGFPNDVAFGHACNSSTGPAATHVYRSRMVDVDDVATPFVEHRVTCGSIVPLMTSSAKTPDHSHGAIQATRN